MRTAGVALCGTMLLMTAACAVGSDDRGAPAPVVSTPSFSSSPEHDAATTTDPRAARGVFERVELSTPPHHGDLSSSAVGIQNFPDAALVTFAADRKAVLDWCRAAGMDVVADAVVGPQDRVVLRGHGDGEGLALCSKDRGQGRGPNVRVTVNGSGATAVAVYSLPAGR